MKKNLAIIVIVVLGFFGIFILARNIIIKTGLEHGVEYATGLPLSIGHLDIGLGKPAITLKNIRLYNPPSFPDRVMIDVPETYIAYNLNDILKKNYHFPEIHLDLKELTVIRNKEGQVNLNALKPAQKEPAKEEQVKGPAAPMPKIQIDKLKLNIGKVVYKDYSQGATPLVQEFPINIHEEFANINDLQGFVSLIVVRTLAKTTVAQLANFDPRHLDATVYNTLHGLKSLGTGTVNTLINKLENIIPFGQQK